MPSFEWDITKNESNVAKHGISFCEAQEVFFDPKRLIALDKEHSTTNEKRWFCIGLINDAVVTVRFTYRRDTIRIFGAGYWRRERKLYEEKNKVH
jgi:uncharacterized DUF497 family protein